MPIVLHNWGDALSTLLLLAALQAGYTILIRTFPDLLGGALLKGVERRNAERIEKLKDELSRKSVSDLEHLRAEYETLKSSTQYIAANQSDLRIKMITAADLLWADMLALRDEYGSLVNFESIFLPDEIRDGFENGKHQKIMRWVEQYRNEPDVTAKLMKMNNQKVEQNRLYVGDRLWLTYYVFRAAVLRLAYMTNLSFKEKKYKDWRSDTYFLSLLTSVLGKPAVEAVTTSSLPSFSIIVGNLESAFLGEAMRIMSGSKTYADSIADVRSSMAYEAARTKADTMRQG